MDKNTNIQEENTNISGETEQMKAIREAAEDMAKRVRNQALLQGAQMICVSTLQIINKHLSNSAKPTLRDYKRCIAEITQFISVPIKKAQEEYENLKETEHNGSEDDHDGTAE